jgi:hypothetical protein
MKKVLWTLCGVPLLTVLLTAPVMGRPFWQSDLVCDLNGDFAFSDLSPQRPSAALLHPSGDLVVSRINGLSPIRPCNVPSIVSSAPTLHLVG